LQIRAAGVTLPSGFFFAIHEGLSRMLDDAQRREFYKSHRERDATGYKKKHRRQYDLEFAALTGAAPSMSVLEIGCGSGLFLRYLEDRGYAEIVGLDMDEHLVEALADLERAEIHLDDVAKLLDGPLAGRRFDRIVMLDVAEHIEISALTALLQRLKDFLKPGGKLMLRVPNVESPWGLRMFFGTFDHVTPLGPGRIRELAMLTGWHCERIAPQEPGRAFRRVKERLVNGMLAGLLSYHPEIWTANLLAVWHLPED
jgi:2-polyprenyl-3-methyl-5-hydroxy-6-metoxy-1,4-benzoquinol methylase